MNKTFIAVFFCCVEILWGKSLRAQSAPDTLAALHGAVDSLKDNFYKNIGTQSRLYSGKEYPYYAPNIRGNAYLMDIKDWNPGSVYYDGYFYKNVDMLYDLYNDEVVILISNKITPISLVSERVKSFDLLGHHFIRIENEPANSNSLKTGFYDELYGGKIQVLARREKSIQNEYSLQTIIPYFSPNTNYYIFKNGTYYEVSSQGSLLAILKDHKKELQQYIKSNKIKFKKDREQAMVKIAAYYDHLTE